MVLVLCSSVFAAEAPKAEQPQTYEPWAFGVICDMRPHKYKTEDGVPAYKIDLQAYKARYVDGATEDRPAPEFLLIPGDFDNALSTDKLFKEVMGEDFLLLPVVGNHERHISKVKSIATYIERIKDKMQIKLGPKGTEHLQYSSTYKNLQVVALNVYWDGTDYPGDESRIKPGGTHKWWYDSKLRPAAYFGSTKKKTGRDGIVRYGLDSNIVPANLEWLKNTLSQSKATYKIVSGHEPAWAYVRYDKAALGDHPESRDKFWKLLGEQNVQIYFCGHSHNYSAYQWLGNNDPNRWKNYTSKIIPGPIGTWQIDAASTRGNIKRNANNNVILYCKVTDEAIEVECYISLKGGTKEEPTWGKWHVPEEGAKLPGPQIPRRFRWKIYPDIKKNLPAKQASKAAEPVLEKAAAGGA